MSVVTVANRHIPECGAPPAIVGDEHHFTSYFEGPCRDQWVYTRDFRTGEAWLRGGDICWGTVVPIISGQPPRLPGGGILVLDEAERLWLAACRMAS